MGIYKRKDSPFWWIGLDGSDQSPFSSKILHDAPTAAERKVLREQASEIYRAKMTDLARARNDLPALKPESITFEKYAAWFATHRLPHHRGAERDALSLQHLRTFFGDTDLTTITKARVLEYATWRLAARIGKPPAQGVTDTRRTVAASTVNREIDLLKSMLREAVPRYLKASPLTGMKRFRHIKATKRILLPVEERRLLKVMRPIDRVFFIVALDSIIRLMNVVNLRRDEFKGTHLALRDSKTGPYEVPLSARARKALASLPEAGQYFFPHRRAAKTDRDRRGAIRLWLRRMCEQAGVPYGRAIGGITFHTGTRATGATRMLQRGHDLRTVQEVGNWGDIRSVQEYLHTDRAHVRAAVESIGAPTRVLRAETSTSKTSRKQRA